MRDGPKYTRLGNANAINIFTAGHARTRPGSKGDRTGSGSLREDGTERTVSGTPVREIRQEAPEAIIADAGSKYQMHCRSELALLCTSAMHGACFDTTTHVAQPHHGT